MLLPISNGKSCTLCRGPDKQMLKCNLNKFVIFRVYTMTGDSFVNLTLEKIPSNFDHNGEKFSLKFLIHFEAGQSQNATGHFICYS